MKTFLGRRYRTQKLWRTSQVRVLENLRRLLFAERLERLWHFDAPGDQALEQLLKQGEAFTGEVLACRTEDDNGKPLWVRVLVVVTPGAADPAATSEGAR